MQDIFDKPFVYHVFIAIAMVTIATLFTRPVRWLLLVLGRKLLARTETALDDQILGVALKHVRPILVVIGLQLAVREIRKGTGTSETTINQVLDYAEILLYVFLVGLGVKVLLGIVHEVIQWYLGRISTEGTSNLKLTLGPLTTKLTTLLVGFVAIIIVLDHFGINIGSLLVSLGVGSLAVALAAQDTIANMIAGFVILVDRPFRVGDRIELAAGQVGDVREIGLRSTRVQNFDNNLIIIPNSELIRSRIVNLSYPEQSNRVLLRFSVAYGADVEAVRGILVGIAGAHPDLLKDPVPQVFVTDVNETAVQLTLVGRAASYMVQWGAETQIRERAYQAFLEHGIRVPVQRRIVEMREAVGPSR
jgi:MscS family membrane protein